MTGWDRAMVLLREAGLDPDAVVDEAAGNLTSWTKQPWVAPDGDFDLPEDDAPAGAEDDGA